MLYLRKEYFSLLGGTYNGSCILQGYVDEKRLKTPGIESRIIHTGRSLFNHVGPIGHRLCSASESIIIATRARDQYGNICVRSLYGRALYIDVGLRGNQTKGDQDHFEITADIS